MKTDLSPSGVITHPRAFASAAREAARAPRNMGTADIVGLLRRNWLTILICALVGAVAVYAYAATLPKRYTAEGAIAVAGDRLAIPELQGALQAGGSPDPMPIVHTEVQALSARQLISEVVNELHLDTYPEFNGALRPPTLFGTIIGTLKSLLPHSPAPPGTDLGNDSVVNAVSHAFAFVQDNRSLVIGVNFTSRDPHLAATAVNRLIADYVAAREKRSANADLGANTAITKRIDEVRSDIKRLEDQMQKLRNTSGLVALRAGSLGQQQVEDLATEASRAAVQRSEIQANLARASAAASSGSSDELGTVLSSPTISRLREQETEAAGRVADMSQQFGPSYPLLQSARANLAAVRAELSGEARRIVASLSTQLKAAQAHEADLENQLAEARKSGSAAQETQAQLEQLQQDVTTQRNLYGTLLASVQQTAAKPQGDMLPDVRVLNTATPPSLPSAPNMKLAAGLGGISGALLAGLVAFTRSGAKARFTDANEVSAATGANILATLRNAGVRGEKLADLSGPNRDALRTGLARLRGAAGTYPPRVLTLVGTQSGRQATAVAQALARVAAGSGQTVLLIEVGAADATAAADGYWRDSVTREPGSALDLLSSGSFRVDPVNRAVALQNLLVEAREEYDLIVLGAPPASGSQAFGLARTSDLTILVVDLAATHPDVIQHEAAQLAAVTQNRLSAIVLGKA